MVEHIVLFKLKANTTEADRQLFVDTMKKLASIEGIVNLSAGVNHSQEGADKGFNIGMRITFRDQASLDAYLPHPHHTGTVGEVSHLFEDVIVVDYTA